MERWGRDEKILCYNDVVLRRSDLDILRGNHYINDRILEFFFSYLSTKYPSQDLLLIPPAISFWIVNSPDKEGLHEFLRPLRLPDKRLVLFPVNDNEDVSLAGGGSHWSLLVYERASNVCAHHDSSGGMNRRCAIKLARAVAPFCSDGEVKYVEVCDSPQQINGYDCGLYVASTAEIICKWRMKNDGDSWVKDVKELVTASSVAQMRDGILSLVQTLKSAK